MAITTKNNTILSKHAADGGYFGACKITNEIAEMLLPVEFDKFWGKVSPDAGSIIDGRIKTLRESIRIIQVGSDEYALFGVCDQNKNRFRPVDAEEFVAWYNAFVDAGCTILTKSQYRGIVETAADMEM